MGKKTKLIHVQYITLLYSDADMITIFPSGIRFCSRGREEDVILEPYLEKEMANMDTFDEPSSSFFYLHLPIIYELRVLVPFTSF